jgi:hypothetical protein
LCSSDRSRDRRRVDVDRPAHAPRGSAIERRAQPGQHLLQIASQAASQQELAALEAGAARERSGDRREHVDVGAATRTLAARLVVRACEERIRIVAPVRLRGDEREMRAARSSSSSLANAS